MCENPLFCSCLLGLRFTALYIEACVLGLRLRIACGYLLDLPFITADLFCYKFNVLNYDAVNVTVKVSPPRPVDRLRDVT